MPKELTRDARERVAGLRAAGGTNDFQQGFQFFATTPECQQGFVNMFEGSRLAECLRELIGPFSPIIACDAHNTPGSDDAELRLVDWRWPEPAFACATMPWAPGSSLGFGGKASSTMRMPMPMAW